MTGKKETQISCSLKDELREMIQNRESLLSCIAVVQKRNHLSLIEAKDLLLQSNVYTEVELEKANNSIQLMMSEFAESVEENDE